MRNIVYLMDQHVITAAEAAYTRCIKCWTPQTKTATVTNNTLAVCDQPQVWLVYHAEVSVVHSNGTVVQGVKMAIIDNGPPRHGGLYLAEAFQTGLVPAVFRGMSPCSYGIGWAIYPAKDALIDGDVVIFRAKYEVDTERRPA